MSHGGRAAHINDDLAFVIVVLLVDDYHITRRNIRLHTAGQNDRGRKSPHRREGVVVHGTLDKGNDVENDDQSQNDRQNKSRYSQNLFHIADTSGKLVMRCFASS